MRSGTLPVPLVVGFGEAAAIALRERDEEAERITRLRDRLHAGIVAGLPEVQLHGHPAERLPGNLNLGFPGVHGEALMMAMKDVACSSGAACSAAEPEPSHVLKAIGLDDDSAKATLRFGLGRFTTEEEIDRAIGYVCDAVVSLRSQSPAWTSVSPA
jgi:cysteine desulfurase